MSLTVPRSLNATVSLKPCKLYFPMRTNARSITVLLKPCKLTYPFPVCLFNGT